MNYTAEMTSFLKTAYLKGKKEELPNSAIIQEVLQDERFSDKTEKSIRAKLGSMKIYEQDKPEKGNTKTDLVNTFISVTGLPRRHHENLMRLNKDVLDDMVECVVTKMENNSNAE